MHTGSGSSYGGKRALKEKFPGMKIIFSGILELKKIEMYLFDPELLKINIHMLTVDDKE